MARLLYHPRTYALTKVLWLEAISYQKVISVSQCGEEVRQNEIQVAAVALKDGLKIVPKLQRITKV